MDDAVFTAKLSGIGILPQTIQSELEILPDFKKSKYFLTKMIYSALCIDDSSNFYDLISVMKTSGHSHVEKLAGDIEAMMEPRPGMITQLRNNVITVFTQQHV